MSTKIAPEPKKVAKKDSTKKTTTIPKKQARPLKKDSPNLPLTNEEIQGLDELIEC